MVSAVAKAPHPGTSFSGHVSLSPASRWGGWRARCWVSESGTPLGEGHSGSGRPNPSPASMTTGSRGLSGVSGQWVRGLRGGGGRGPMGQSRAEGAADRQEE